MTKAAGIGNVEVIKEILKINPELLKERDRSGWNAMTMAASLGKAEVIKAIGEINPELLKEQDGSGSK